MEEHTVWKKTLHQFRESAAGFDRVWQRRSRIFNTYNVVLALLNLCGGEEKSYRSMLEHFSEELKCTPSASSFCVSRQKMPSYIIKEIRNDLLDLWDSETKNSSFFGFRAHAVDGSWLNLPRELLAQDFKVASKGYYPRGLLTSVFRVSDRMLVDINLTNTFDEREAAKSLLDNFTAKDLLIFDRGYFSYLFLLEHLKRGIAAVFRVPKGNNLPQIEAAWDRNENDFIIELNPGKNTLKMAMKNDFEFECDAVRIRIIKYKVANEEYMLITNVFDESISVKDFQGLYWKRWMIEEFYKPYKQSIKIEKFHSKSLNGVEQEIQAAGLLWNLMQIMDKMIPETFKKSA